MDTLRLFCDLAACRSFSQAAGRHGVTQSAASQRINRLEKRLGLTLVDRSVRPLVLTPAGEEFARECREILERYDVLERRIAKLKPQSGGEVVVSAIYSAGIDLLNQVKESFEQKHPRVTVRVDYRRPQEVYDAVRQDRCDLGILSYPQRWPEVGVIPLRHERMAVVCHPRHKLAQYEVVQASDLDRWAMLTFEASLPVGRRIRRYLREHRAAPRVLNVFDNIDTIKNALAVTEAFAILPRRTVWREAVAGTLALVELEPELLRPLGIIYHRGRRSNGSSAAPFGGVAQAFVDYLLQHAGPGVDLVQDIENTAAKSGLTAASAGKD
ncbi:MAG: LysR family transcriptional regulator [Phycisphaeraceae bacterium]